MKRIVSLIMMAGLFVTSVKADDDILTGDTRLSCEAIMCLSTGSAPDECEPSLRRYFDIREKKLSDTIKERRNFLKKCPASNQTPEMQGLVDALASGAGRCDALYLNRTTKKTIHRDEEIITIIDNNMPIYCSDYTNNQYVNLGDEIPKYVGDPENGGHWVNSSDYEKVLTEYNARLAKQKADQAEMDAYNGR
ncbi:conjugal transfer protein TrbM [Desulfopila sp. IMCC35006]|uniref:TrbM/KikA/MpfK family conjugal transfer protein n=1 Tax=Desulfopila sp. IMCC35006 TaxID=2569542 RepID=UPI0010AC7EBF|nr:TrbM/KikA/MpfK family conjugal transfer protein [Desulfopila sp. IMCC35006]TKB23479.1 conjugal transfer protein TrbM [Desulfopila sp. IMCC35006]